MIVSSEICQGLMNLIALRRQDAAIITGIDIDKITRSAILSTVLVKDLFIRILVLMILCYITMQLINIADALVVHVL